MSFSLHFRFFNGGGSFGKGLDQLLFIDKSGAGAVP